MLLSGFNENKGVTGGFTILEVIIVVSIIAILTAVSAPNISDWVAGARIRSSAREMASYMQFARMRALSENNDFFVCFDTIANQYVVLDDDNSDGIGVDSDCDTEGDDVLVKTLNLPNGVVLDYASGAKGPPDNPTSALTDPVTFGSDDVSFEPDGSTGSETGFAYVRGANNDTYAIGIRRSATGVVEVWYLRDGTTDGWERR